MKSLKIKLKLNNNQKLIIETLSNEHRLLYNFLLNYVKTTEGCNFKSINEQYKLFRHVNNLTINSKSSQNTCKMLINNIKSYFSLRKKDKTAKFPYKFKSYKFFTSFTYDWNQGNGGFKIINDTVVVTLNNQKNKLIIDLPNELLSINDISDKTIKTITFKREEDKYFLIFVYSEKNSNIVLNKNNFISIDLGMSEIVTCFSNTLPNFSIKNNKFESLNKTINKLNSVKDLKKKYSKKWIKINNKFLNKKRKLSNKQKDFQHKLSKNIIQSCIENDIGTLIVGDIQTKKVINKENKKIKSTSKNFGLSRFKTFLEYKSENENINFYKPNESWTSQTNCLTNEKFDKHIDLKDREVNLTKEIKIDRDLNSAINIATKIMGECLPQFETLEFHKMYMDNQSNFICI